MHLKTDNVDYVPRPPKNLKKCIGSKFHVFKFVLTQGVLFSIGTVRQQSEVVSIHVYF